MIKKILFIGVLFAVACKNTKQTATYALAKEMYQKDTLYYLNPDSLDNEKVLGKEVVTYGKVVQIKPHKTEESGTMMYFINLNKVYSNNAMTAMVFTDSYKGDFQKMHKLEGKTIFVKGVVEKLLKYKERDVPLKPSIKLIDEDQIKIISDF